ncbi:leucine zipper domain-containing protein [Chelatococcus asaccharovorans]|uniref:Transposase IS481 family protein n=1 Tax=Chelatococcus asaccharovorans TaxID=28210 RepID=A0A2V3TUA8_9HYPH|nr:leucine zipper domain-containing protein [Chelatococcus asaccharovorans]MBS7704984.1 hypothetical protein [Chelatococcus asaccharovorans]PXW51898.1 transposase IS481 family protein [Chelatococcus asaccharovorans]
MNVHKNARLTVHGRVLLVRRVVEEDWTVVAASEAAGERRMSLQATCKSWISISAVEALWC